MERRLTDKILAKWPAADREAYLAGLPIGGGE
jgi:hypothetical protein